VVALIQSVIAEGGLAGELAADDLLRRGRRRVGIQGAVTCGEREAAPPRGDPPSAERDGLIALADYVVSRDR
jgi:hypothetical protein